MPRVKTGGRVKGTPNKSTASVKQALTEAFDKLGGVASLLAWAKNEPAEFYRIWSKMLPLDIAGSFTGAIKVEIAWVESWQMGDGERVPSVIASDN